MPRKLHPLAERALRTVGTAGRRALENAVITAADSVLEDVEGVAGGAAGQVRAVRTRIQERKAEDMGRKGRRAAEEEEELEEDVEEDDAEEEDDDEEGSDDAMLIDAECFVRNALYLLEAAVEEGKVSKKLLHKLEEVHEELSEALDEA